MASDDSHLFRPGTVYLVGGGPGDPGLLTLRGRDCLAAADVVLYDGLVSPLLLRHTNANCERMGRAEGHGERRLDQAEINERLVAEAKSGKVVVRLKGGDPFLFGRGSEEAAALAAAGVPFEVVPGVTAAIAAAAYAGLSLTHRELASSVAFVTGHEDPSKPDAALDYAALAAFPGTLVFYMGLHRLGRIAEALVAAGKPGETSACVISRATTPRQRTVAGTLAELPRLAAAAELHAPSLIVVGDCVRQRDVIAWYERKPLLGLKVGVTRPEGQADGVVERLLSRGAEPVLMPLLEVRPPECWSGLDDAISRLDRFDWVVFTSVNGVSFFLDRLWEAGGDLRRLAGLRLAAIGPATAGRLEEAGLRADLVPEEYRAEGLVEALRPVVAGGRVLWVGADRGREVLIDGLTGAGAEVTKVTAYRSGDVPALGPQATEMIAGGELDWIGLSSPAMARGLARLLPDEIRPRLGNRTRLASISPVTSQAAREAGLPVAAEAREFTWEGIVRAIEEAEAGRRAGGLP